MKASTLQVAGVISHGGFPQPHGNVDRTLISRVLSGLRLQRHLLYTGRSSLRAAHLKVRPNHSLLLIYKGSIHTKLYMNELSSPL